MYRVKIKKSLTHTFVHDIMQVSSTNVHNRRGDCMLVPKTEEIKRRRNELGLTKKGLSKKAGLPDNAILRIERGEGRFTHPIRARAIATALRCEVTDIFTETKGA